MADATALLIPMLVLGVLVLMFYVAVAPLCRQWALQQWAHGHGCQLFVQEQPDVQKQFRDFGCLYRGEEKHHSTNLIRGKWNDHPLMVFDYHFQRRGKGPKRHLRHHHRFTAVVLGGCRWPCRMLIQARQGDPEDAAWFGGKDVSDLGGGAVDWRRLRASDSRIAGSMWDEGLASAVAEHPDLSVQLGGEYLMVYGSRLLEDKELDSALRLAERLASVPSAQAVVQVKL
jgi:hypothetical protein